MPRCAPSCAIARLRAGHLPSDLPCTIHCIIAIDSQPADGSLPDTVPFVRYGNRPADVSWSAAFPQNVYVRYKVLHIDTFTSASLRLAPAGLTGRSTATRSQPHSTGPLSCSMSTILLLSSAKPAATSPSGVRRTVCQRLTVTPTRKAAFCSAHAQPDVMFPLTPCVALTLQVTGCRLGQRCCALYLSPHCGPPV